MAPAVFITIVSVLSIVGIYFWWVRKPQPQPTREIPIRARDAHR
jgi:hypothetical protein